MDGVSAQDNLELEVENFGPIGRAKLDLRPFTVFVGPSNTGKSYLAILIYALHRYFDSERWLKTWMYRTEGRDGGQLPRENLAPLKEWAKQVLKTADRLQAERRGVDLPSSVVNFIHSGFRWSGGLGDEICRCFGIGGAGALIRKVESDAASIVLRRRSPENSTHFESRITIRPQMAERRSTFSGESRIPIGTREAKEEFKRSAARIMWAVDHAEDRIKRSAVGMVTDVDPAAPDTEVETWDTFVWQEIKSLAYLALPHIFGPLNFRAFYLPADRTGVMHAHSVVVSSLIGRAPMAGLRPDTHTPMLSGVLADFLEQLIEPDRPPHPRRRPLRDLGRPIEELILDGSVNIERAEQSGYPRFTYRPTGWEDDLPLMNVSSMVSELAPVVLYLRHKVEPGNVLIVEEPEAHLHPEMQVKFTRLLAALVRAGVRVIVTTHSEWVLEELANIVRRSVLTETERETMEGGNYELSSDEVGAWLFQPTSPTGGSKVTEIGLDESGLYPSGFDEVAAALHNNWAEISSRIDNAE